MRRLPLFLVVDVSESMIGDNLKQMQHAVGAIARALRADPQALETACLSVIAFAGIARTLAPLTDVATFTAPVLPVGGGTSLGAALTHLMGEIDASVAWTTSTRKGDWRPVVFLFTDGKPTDAYEPAIALWKESYAHKADLVAVALGRFADLEMLRGLTDQVHVLEETSDDSFHALIRWVSASVVAHSRSLGTRAEGIALLQMEGDAIKLAKLIPGSGRIALDPDHVILIGRCQDSREPYVMKYERFEAREVFEGRTVEVKAFQVAGCYPVTEAYFQWSGGDPSTSERINTSELMGAPECPHCGNATAFAQCGCGGLFCINGPGRATCPWCRKTINFTEGSADFETRRGRG